MEKTTAIILGGGTGSRLGADVPKQFLQLGDKMIIEHTLWTFEKSTSIDSIIIVSIESHLKKFEEIVKSNNFSKVEKIIVGGNTRQKSVSNGLNNTTTKYVLVHDGVRPFVSAKSIENIVESIKKYDSGALAVPSNDSLKICNNMEIEKSLDRSKIWAMQTPQGFKTELLKKAHFLADSEEYIGTDESELVERLGVKVKIVEGEYSNIKITTAFDLELGKLILGK